MKVDTVVIFVEFKSFSPLGDHKPLEDLHFDHKPLEDLHFAHKHLEDLHFVCTYAAVINCIIVVPLLCKQAKYQPLNRVFSKTGQNNLPAAKLNWAKAGLQIVTEKMKLLGYWIRTGHAGAGEELYAAFYC